LIVSKNAWRAAAGDVPVPRPATAQVALGQLAPQRTRLSGWGQRTPGYRLDSPTRVHHAGKR